MTSKDEGQSAAEHAHEHGKSIKLHPLAIVGISDHHTRVVVGGSHMGTDSSVVGLLFGIQDGMEISILDCQEMDYTPTMFNESGNPSKQQQQQVAVHKTNLETQIGLHKKVFPKHEVVGWYRVHPKANENDGSSKDPIMGQLSNLVRGFLHESSSNPLMLWMHPDFSLSGDGGSGAVSGSNAGTKSQKEIPIRMFECVATFDSNQHRTTNEFVPQTFEVDTEEPERIAVEKAFSDQPTGATSSTNGVVSQTQSLESGIKAMSLRLQSLLQFVEDCKSSKEPMTPQTHRKLRQVEGILSQLPIFASHRHNEHPNAAFDDSYGDVLTISFLAAMNKSANALHKYSEKVKVVQESNKKKQQFPSLSLQSGETSSVLIGGFKSMGGDGRF